MSRTRPLPPLAQEKMTPAIDLLKEAHTHIQNGLQTFAKIEQHLYDLAGTKLNEVEQNDLEYIYKPFSEMCYLSRKYIMAHRILDSRMRRCGTNMKKEIKQ